MSEKFIWQGKELKTFGDALAAICDCKTPEEALEFMEAYRKITPHADENVGYMTGNLDDQEARRVKEWFKVRHPIFGDSRPTPEEAFRKGQELGRASKVQRTDKP